MKSMIRALSLTLLTVVVTGYVVTAETPTIGTTAVTSSGAPLSNATPTPAPQPVVIPPTSLGPSQGIGISGGVPLGTNPGPSIGPGMSFGPSPTTGLGTSFGPSPTFGPGTSFGPGPSTGFFGFQNISAPLSQTTTQAFNAAPVTFQNGGTGAFDSIGAGLLSQPSTIAPLGLFTNFGPQTLAGAQVIGPMAANTAFTVITNPNGQSFVVAPNGSMQPLPLGMEPGSLVSTGFINPNFDRNAVLGSNNPLLTPNARTNLAAMALGLNPAATRSSNLAALTPNLMNGGSGNSPVGSVLAANEGAQGNLNALSLGRSQTFARVFTDRRLMNDGSGLTDAQLAEMQRAEATNLAALALGQDAALAARGNLAAMAAQGMLGQQFAADMQLAEAGMNADMGMMGTDQHTSARVYTEGSKRKSLKRTLSQRKLAGNRVYLK